jgi:HAD superfamily hydrolase (TIGR01509 family)
MQMSAQPIAAVVFDMDGTLFDSSEAVPDTYIEYVRELAGITMTRQDVIDLYSVGPPGSLLAAALGRPCTDTEVNEYHVRLQRNSNRLTLYAGVTDMLTTLGTSFPLVVFTGASKASADMLIDASGLTSHFQLIVGTDQVGAPKPSPDGLHYVSRELGLRPDQLAYVGDSPLDTRAALACGAMGIAAGWGHLHDSAEPCTAIAATPSDVCRIVGQAGHR